MNTNPDVLDALSILERVCAERRDLDEVHPHWTIGELITNADPETALKILCPELIWSPDLYNLSFALCNRDLKEPACVISELTVKDDAGRFRYSLTVSGHDVATRVWLRFEVKDLPDRKCRFLADKVIAIDHELDPRIQSEALGEVRQIIKSVLDNNKK